MGIFLPYQALPGLKQYKCIEIFPRWMAPNLITLLGLGFVVINLLSALYYNPTFDQECAWWLYLSYAVGLFLYQTFDACDGLQARRTGQSGPLGELFDHCCDAINTTLEVLIFCSVTNTGYSWAVVASQFATLLNFYLSTWEEYHTGALFLSEFSGPVEGIIIIIAMYLTTAFMGPGVWHRPLVCGYSFMQGYLVFAGVGLFANTAYASLNVCRAKRANNQPIRPLLVQSIPFIYYFGTLFAWYYVNPLLVSSNLLLPMVFSTGLSVALTVGQIITAHVSKQSFPSWNILMICPTIGVIFDLFVFEATGTAAMVWGLCGASIAIYGCFVYEVIQEITSYLDIGCLYIKHKKD